MKVINVNQNNNVGFGAKIEFITGTKKYLPKSVRNELMNRANSLGTNDDSIIVSIVKEPVYKEEERFVAPYGLLGFLFGINILEKEKYKRLVKMEPCVYTSGIFPSINEIVPLQRKTLPVGKGNIKENSAKYLDRYFSYLEKLFNNKKI